MSKTAIPPFQTEPLAMHPALEVCLGEYDYNIIDGAGGLTQFGMHIEVLRPRAKSSLNHWNQTEEEMVDILSGEVVLVEEDETILCKGDVACWPAGAATDHYLGNRSVANASYLTIGSCNQTETVHYPDHNLITYNDGEARRHCQSDGSPYPERTLK